MISPHHRSDFDLVQGVLRGRSDSLERLVPILARVPAMVRGKHQQMGSPLRDEELDDVVQETLAASWRKLSTYRGEAALSTWVYGFVVRELLKARQRRSRGNERRVGWDHLSPGAAGPEELPDPEPVPTDGALVRVAIDELEEPFADVLRAKYFEDWTFERISKENDLPLGTVKTRYYRALELLRTKLEPTLRSAR